ncbi:MAG: hypothetical protein ACO1OC_02325 [Tuberibacillus sp.]
MKNVIINKIVQYVFTEDQLRGKWLRAKKERPFEDLTSQELMELAKKILAASSHSDLEEYAVGSAWRTKSDVKGKMVGEDDSDPTMHIEIIDTDLKSTQPKDVVIDRLHRLVCLDCGFLFSIEDLDYDITQLKCPCCGGNIASKRG